MAGTSLSSNVDVNSIFSSGLLPVEKNPTAKVLQPTHPNPAPVANPMVPNGAKNPVVRTPALTAIVKAESAINAIPKPVNTMFNAFHAG